ncbi:DUF6705 family protein [Flavobacterium microcysteis]|uniref:DUF6705 domain-containing protein n=1 Tax=Flavobacterium microcysteis TaxID=2596891 RepID=A0A501Q775_9FLAO|nr:DUF6705 family protein [Flavobacterium microcysteis]TPD68258.1 hypothetical protein FJA49_09315 [Flavobacterium microcysteis]
MKNIFLILMLITSFLSQAQIVDIKNLDSQSDLPSGSYIKDINGDFDKFVGTWVWVDAGKSVTFKLQKITRYLDSEYNNYSDFMIGDYSYSSNGRVIVNTISQNSDPNPDLHPMYSCCPYETQIMFSFKDVRLRKDECRAFFEFLPGSTTQMKLTLKNNEGPRGTLVPEGGSLDITQSNPSFIIPNDIILTKQ